MNDCVKIEFGDKVEEGKYCDSIPIKINEVRNIRIRLKDVFIYRIGTKYVGDTMDVIVITDESSLSFFKKIDEAIVQKCNSCYNGYIYERKIVGEYGDLFFDIDNKGCLKEVRDARECVRIYVDNIKDYSKLKPQTRIDSLILNVSEKVYVNKYSNGEIRVKFNVVCYYENIVFRNEKEEIEKRVKRIEEMIYMPGGVGYHEAKNDFDSLVRKESLESSELLDNDNS